jgi:hypothetical protein
MTINISLLFVFHILVAIATGYYAKRKNRNPLAWGGLALLPGLNVLLLLFLFFSSPVNESEVA